jgi:hypothetical protein
MISACVVLRVKKGAGQASMIRSIIFYIFSVQQNNKEGCGNRRSKEWFMLIDDSVDLIHLIQKHPIYCVLIFTDIPYIVLKLLKTD